MRLVRRCDMAGYPAVEFGVAPDCTAVGRAEACLAALEPACVWGALAGAAKQGLVMPREHREGRAARAQAQSQTPGRDDDPGRDADDLLHHGANTAPLGGMAHRTVRADQGRLAEWFRGPLKDKLYAALASQRMADTGLFDMAFLRRMADDHARGRRDYSASLWSLYMFEAFLRQQEMQATFA